MTDLVTWHPPAHFRLLSDIAGKTLDPAIKNVVVYGNAQLGKGGARYSRITGSIPAPLVGSPGAQDLGDGTYIILDADQTIRVTMFGATLDGATDDGPELLSAHTFCANARSGLYVPLRFPVGQLRILSGAAINLIDNMHWAGEGNYANEHLFLSTISTSFVDIFSFNGANKDFMTFSGMCFDGRSQAKSLMPAGTSPVLFHSRFAYCGFRNFWKVFGCSMSGCIIQGSYFQNNRVQIETGGADSMIQNNYMSGSNWASGGNSDLGPNPAAGPTTWGVIFGSMRLTRYVRNYMTGHPQMLMRQTGAGDGTMIHGNWFDICDLTALSLENTHGQIVSENTFNRTMIGSFTAGTEGSFGTTSATYNAIIRLIASTDIVFHGNHFGYQSGGLGGTGAVPSPSPLTLNATGATQRYALRDNLYLSPYVRSVAFDATAHPPRISGEIPGLDVLPMGNADLTFRPMQADLVYANTPLTVLRSCTLSKTGAEENDAVRITRSAAATGAFNLNVLNGSAGPNLKSLTAASQWADFRYDGANWVETASGVL